MSSRPDHHKRERSWEREDRDRNHDRDRNRDKDRYSRSARTGGYRDNGRRRDSRSRSPRRDRRDYDRDRDYKSSRRDDRRDRDRGDRRHDRKEDRKSERKSERMDEKRDQYTPERITSKDNDVRSKETSWHGEHKRPEEPRFNAQFAVRIESSKYDVPASTSSRPNLDPDTPVEDGEEMDATTAEEESMMAMMGLASFSSTKGKHVEGNQEGATNIKKMRTWRQYMNRRGGFNRPLDKIK